MIALTLAHRLDRDDGSLGGSAEGDDREDGVGNGSVNSEGEIGEGSSNGDEGGGYNDADCVDGS